ncbi:MAG: ATP-binding cassette domain-containing protein [Porphyrobacter sp.]|jgi:ATPase subunit of ABC transporter with duplicated ATPase domains|nr:ATP-binding cassette domain-containing protein [Porphyrobacter sp.]
MSSFVTLDSVTVRGPDGTRLFGDLSLAIGAERVGLVGRNGSGKSTLLRIIAGEARPASGSIAVGGRVRALEQNPPAGWTIAEALGVAREIAILDRVLAGNGSADDLAAADWTLDQRIAAALARAGLAEMDLSRRLATLSGGERTRVGIARLLLEAPDVLLLDEPTNNLDAAGRAAIAALVRDWTGGVLVASHDRELLEAMDRIVELAPTGVTVFGGGWTAFEAYREAERLRIAERAARAEADLRETQRRAQAKLEAKARRDKTGRAFAARGSEPKILLGAKAEQAENSLGRQTASSERQIAEAQQERDAARARIEVLAPLRMTMPYSGMPSGTRLLALDRVEVSRGERRFGPWTLQINGAERVAVVGANGTGKTTLLSLAAGLLAPQSGTLHRIAARTALLDQHVARLDPAASIVDNLLALHPDLTSNEAFAACARFAFRNRDARRLVGTLSGGERLRAGLTVALGGKIVPWLLILDEPTNHLDLETIEILEDALASFDGAMLVVSHDQPFLERIGVTRRFAV